MRMNKKIVVTDWIKEKPQLGSFLKLTLSSDERRILRGKRLTDCDQEVILQLPREGKLNDGDILSTLSLIHISEPTRLLSISYAVFCLKKKKMNSKANAC